MKKIMKWLVLVLLITGCAAKEKYVLLLSQTTSAKLSGEYASKYDLMQKSPLIVQGNVESVSVPFTYGGIDFVKIQFVIQEEWYSEIKHKDEITILREAEMFEPLEKGEYVLFLEEYSGPIAEDVYMVCGGNTGAYKVETSSKKIGRPLHEFQDEVDEYIERNRK